MKVTRPSKNTLTQGYSLRHRSYDFSGRGDDGAFACLKGTIIISRDLYKTAWLQGGFNDPTPWGLTTEDYGNFIKLRHDDGSCSLYAHLRHGTPLKVGTKVDEGDKIAVIGHTGNSTARHLHYEFRNPNNQPVYFKEETMEDEISIPKKTFEKLVSNSSKYDEFNRIGYGSAAEVTHDLQGLRQSIDDKAEVIKAERERADGARKDYNDLLALVADALNTQQEENQVKVALNKVKTQLDELDDLRRTIAALQLSTGIEKEELNVEVARLKALLKNEGALDDYKLEELLTEIISRLGDILRRKK